MIGDAALDETRAGRYVFRKPAAEIVEDRDVVSPADVRLRHVF